MFNSLEEKNVQDQHKVMCENAFYTAALIHHSLS